MARFYFHLSTGEDYERDEVGSDHVDANQAYLEAFESAQQLSVDLIREHLSPIRHRFDICDEYDRVLFQVPFAEIMGRRPGPHELMHTAARGQNLAADVRNEIGNVRAELQSLWDALKRI